MVIEPRKQAARGQKQILKENKDTLLFYTCVITGANVAYLGITWLFFWEALTFKFQMLFLLTTAIYLGAYLLMRLMARPRFSKSPTGGEPVLVDAGVDLNMNSGMAEHLKDIILLLALVQGIALLWNYAWWALLVIPGRAAFMAWRSFIAPWLFAPAPPDMDEKKQKKLERRGNRAPQR